MARKKNAPAVDAKVQEKLARSGLTMEDAGALGIRILTATETAALCPGQYEPLPSLLFTYHDIDGAPVPVTDFHRIRYTEVPDTGGWGAQLAKPHRYRQPAGSTNWVYLPTSLPWDTVAGDPEIPLVITEGELKAACACKRRIPTLGLGGVDVFQATKRGVDSLPPLDRIVWKGRRVYVVFDTDTPAGLKDTVLEAARRVLEWLMHRGAVPALSVLPGAPDGAKVGLDDFLVAHPDMTGEGFVNDVLRMGEVPYAPAMKLLAYAQRYGFVSSISRFVEKEPRDGGFHPMDAGTLNIVSRHTEITMTRKRSTRVKDLGWVSVPAQMEVTLDKALMICPNSSIYDGVVYRPGAPRETDNCYNLWSGWACEYEGPRARCRLPDPAERERFLADWERLMDLVYGDSRSFTDHWYYHPLRFPGTKHYTGMMVWSPEQGVGKSIVPELLAKHVYGVQGPGPVHAAMINSEQLEGAFSHFYMARSFLMGEEIAADRRNPLYDKLKDMVTTPNLTVNIKHVPQFVLENYLNVVILSNHELVVRMDEDDRRFFVHRVRLPTLAGFAELCHRVSSAFKSGVGGPALLWYARSRYAPGAFNPKDKAPMTAAKRAMIGVAAYPELDWLRDLVANRLQELLRTLVTADELDALYRKESPSAREQNDRFGRHLSRLGCEQYKEGRRMWVPYGNGRARQRIWSLVNHERNLALTVEEVERLMEKPLLSDKVVPIAKGRKY